MKRLWSLILILCFLPLPAIAEAAPNGYVARVSGVSLYGLSENAAPTFVTIPDRETAEQYLAEGLISYFEPNCEAYLCGEYVYYMQENVKLPEVWEKGFSGEGVKVGVVDSGVYPHADFGENLLEGYNVLTDTTDTTDTYGHGTRVAGLIAAAGNGVGAKGAAPGAQIVPVKCFDGKTADLNHVVYGIVKAVELGCDIINLSFGANVYRQSMAEAVEYARNKGVLLVAAAGNDYTDSLCYPAAFPGVIGVGAVSKTDEWEPYSQYNVHVDISAPGCCVGSTNIDGSFIPTTTDYGTAMGTSFSAPLVSGILALGMAAEPSLSPAQYITALLSSARDAGEIGWDPKFGYGIADAVAFLEKLSGVETMPQIKTRTDYPQVMEIEDGIAVYIEEPCENAFLIAAIYEGNMLTDATCLAYPMKKGYTSFTISLPKNCKVFVLDEVRPLATPLVK